MATHGITAMWTAGCQSGRVPGWWGSSSDAEKAARDFMVKYPQVTEVSLYHATGGHLRDIQKREES